MTFSQDPQDTWQGPRVRMRNLSAFKIIGAIGAERRAKGGALFHIITTTYPYLTMKNFHWLPHKGGYLKKVPPPFLLLGTKLLKLLKREFYRNYTKKHLMFAEMTSLKYKGKNNVPVSALSIASKYMHCTPGAFVTRGQAEIASFAIFDVQN